MNYARGLLRAALEEAVENDMLSKNPVKKQRRVVSVTEEDSEPQPVAVWDADQQRAFIDATAGSRWNIVWRLALGSGLRRGRALRAPLGLG